MPIPKYPVLFYKPKTALSATGDDIVVPTPALIKNQTDYECELVVVIGRECKDITPEQAYDYILGYAVGNDVSHRDWQLNRGSQWNLGKMFDGFAPFGPAIVSKEVTGTPDSLQIYAKLNGDNLVQNESTGDMIFNVPAAVSFLSQGTTLLPGDVIFMGTPSGVGMGRSPPVWLKNGDVVEVGLSKVGSIVNKVVFEDQRAKL
ncbi:Fmp41p [Sugiyamaella lignohabitans]|uniref:Fmp41p n=1 Tax=Sugiyamaella lignohabitans TaxID=796027 RepID=A0A167F626_9ASCO|nr:Fmp41p [Sugiyamaella lignohabitans]ANB14881.1 Fmp41p [Sugiyamaella lignohabitans]